MNAILQDNFQEKIKELCEDLSVAVNANPKRQVYDSYLNRLDEIQRLLDDIKLELRDFDYQDKRADVEQELYEQRHPHFIRDENDL